MTTPALRLIVLRVLADTRPYALPQPTLLAEVNRLARPAITLGELVKLLSWLKTHALIAFLPDAMDPENADSRRWLITEAGLGALQQ